MKLIFALGNTGPQYVATRHNVAWQFVDSYTETQSLEWNNKSKLGANIVTQGSGDAKVIIAKPTTYYNNVGQSLRAIADFYKISAEDTLVIADDLALPFGTIRTRQGGSDAGNNGIKSVNAHGGDQTWRLRIGIYNQLRERMNDADFVLSRFSANEAKLLKEFQSSLEAVVTEFVRGDLKATTHKLIDS